jgi:hypothetical protein
VNTYVAQSGAASVRLYNEIYAAPGAVTGRFDDGFVLAGPRYYHGDHLGSARQMSNANAYPVWEVTESQAAPRD